MYLFRNRFSPIFCLSILWNYIDIIIIWGSVHVNSDTVLFLIMWVATTFFAFSIILEGNAYSAEDLMNVIDCYRKYDQIALYGCNRKELVMFSKTLLSNGIMSTWMSEIPTNVHVQRSTFVLIGLECGNASSFLQKANQNGLFRNPSQWIVKFPKNTLFHEEIQAVLKKMSILVDSDFIIVRHNEDIEVERIYKKSEALYDFETEVLELHNEPLIECKSEPAIRLRKNLSIPMNVSIVVTDNDTLNHLTDKREKHIDSITKVNYALVLALASIHNISLNFSITNTWGYLANDSRWTGMMGDLTLNRAEIGGTSLFLIRERIDVIDYIAMISPTRSKFVFRQPKLSYVTNVYTLPFDNKVWYSTIASVILMGLTFFILMKWEILKQKYIEKDPRSPHEGEQPSSISDVALITVGAMCQQSTTTLPYSIPGRIAIFFTFITLMFIYVSYAANIVALLQTSSNSIRTLEDLLKSRIPLGVHDTVFNHFYFTTATEPIRKAIYKKKVAPPGKSPNFMKIEEGVERMRQGLFAFHMETGSGYKIVSETFKEDEKCGLREIQFLQVVDPWIAIKKNSSYKKMFKIGFLLLHETGIQQRENNLIYTRRPTCVSKTSTFFSVEMVDCYPALAILVIGAMISFVIFISELYLCQKFDNDN